MKIYVIDLETTGLYGAPIDSILEIGIASVDLATGSIAEEYSAIIRQDPSDLDHYTRRYGTPWIFEKGLMTREEVINGKEEDVVSREVRDIIYQSAVTAYNVPFDFGRFLYRSESWNFIREDCWIPFDIADLVKANLTRGYSPEDLVSLIALPGLRGDIYQSLSRNPDRRVHMWDAYRIYCPHDAMRVSVQSHRAIEDAICEASIVKELLCRRD